MNLLHLNHKNSFIKIHPKELNRAFRELSPINFILFLLMTKLILQFDSKLNIRRITLKDLLKEVPMKISMRTLKNGIKILFDQNFISKFTSTDRVGRRINVYSLVNPPLNKEYSVIPNFFLDDLIHYVDNPFMYKIYLLLYSSITILHQTKFTKTLQDISNLIGITPTQYLKSKVSKTIRKLKELELIEFQCSQPHIFAPKKWSFKLNFSSR